MNQTSLDTVTSGPQGPTNPLVGRLLTTQEVDNVLCGYAPGGAYGKQYTKNGEDHCQYEQNAGDPPYDQDCS